MRRVCAFLFVLIAVCGTAAAQTDEIQVYDGGLAPPGVFNLTLHTNYIQSGITEAAYPGAVTADGSVNGVPEWAVGVTRWMELGLYLPVYSYDQHMGWGIDGWKPRALFAVPNADDRRFFYGANFEFSVNRSDGTSTTTRRKSARSSAGISRRSTSSSIQSWTRRMTVSRTSTSLRQCASRTRGPLACARGRRVRRLWALQRHVLGTRAEPPAVRSRRLHIRMGPRPRSRSGLRPDRMRLTTSPSS